ncbi:FMN-binding negative transcriptional regulator [Piscinibacter sp. HJYY11]|uniref:FMN-binding negative transcriptional regulator n=1 Tax=Piscinibacter sp. HJYY11 TaxID=2801333 RepID=UPI00191D98E7|nr:FMN-binding negative transcriptional regulator [Piscinibacter sp. HJYY11]MBL0728814.1 FMN-binding negative transcriptional regulator [Piscinibacter sp. HJYY11]
MYTPSHFDEQRPEPLQQLLHDHPLGLLITNGQNGLDANPVPFLHEPREGTPGVLSCHVARANPVWKEAAGEEVLVVFQGPQAYVSPNWYPSKFDNGKAVPTWNYIVVQARGTLVVRDEVEWLRGFVTRLTQRHESTQAVPWQVGDAPPDYLDAMLRGIVGLEIPLSSLRGKWKMSQNHPAANREGVARGLRARGTEATATVAGWVERAAPSPAKGQ